MEIARTDVVGSLLRPPELLAVRDRFERGEASAAELKRAEDRAVDAAVELQEAAGIAVVTDGEMRRLSFQSGLPDAVDGFGDVPLDAYLWGDWHGDDVGDRATARPAGLGVRERAAAAPAHRRRGLHLPARPRDRDPQGHAGEPQPVREPVVGGASRATPTPRSTTSSTTSPRSPATRSASFTGSAAPTSSSTRPHYPLLIDPATRAFYEGQGWTAERWLDRGIELDNWVMEGHPEVTFGFHLCRGNQASRWLVEGGYEPIARQVFRGVNAQRLLLEYDDERSGSFQPLSEVPDDKVVVLGLVTTKSPRRETVEELAGRIHEAARHIDLERLAISPQCGFATSVLGNALTPDDQRPKLETLARTAEPVWG